MIEFILLASSPRWGHLQEMCVVGERILKCQKNSIQAFFLVANMSNHITEMDEIQSAIKVLLNV